MTPQEIFHLGPGKWCPVPQVLPAHPCCEIQTHEGQLHLARYTKENPKQSHSLPSPFGLWGKPWTTSSTVCNLSADTPLLLRSASPQFPPLSLPWPVTGRGHFGSSQSKCWSDWNLSIHESTNEAMPIAQDPNRTLLVKLSPWSLWLMSYYRCWLEATIASRSYWCSETPKGMHMLRNAICIAVIGAYQL